ncbi:hypothetical protein [Sphingomonas sp.]|uniref:hypothetical protein n=1 Tax=Sphingomonas sp. TaxID=28214 RepID=UPI0018192BD3|nr:hypothetical protein [Sphingomonas sp.]MBA3512319.1 hypothetical protein [Sphingomonas sp.]
MASEVTQISRDGNWKVEVEAWRNNFLFYSSIGAQFSIYRKGGSSIWGGTSWDSGRARRVTMRNSYNGGLAFQDGQWNDAHDGELKHWAVGIAIKIPSGDITPGGPWLTLTSVESIVEIFLANGEAMNIRVNAGNFITDSSIW